MAGTEILDALVLGGGFGGIQMLHELREMGMKAIALEAGSDVGGAWYWNRYPGARCDVESLVYCYSFSPIIDAEWKWSERYAAQPEIRAYMGFVVDRLDLRKDIRFNSRLVKAHYDKASNLWNFETENGDRYQARYFISSAGPISAPIWPDIPDRDKFKGTLLHSALWPRDKEPDFTGKRVGVIGTGSSGTQLIPLVAPQAEKLTVFVRTPSLYMPARNRPLTDEDYARWEQSRENIRSRMRSFEIVGSGDIFVEEELHEIRKRPGTDFTPEERRAILERRFAYGGATVPRAFADVATNQQINDEISAFICEQVPAIVKDPKTAAILTPTGIAYGTRRVTVGTDYYETYNRDNVEAVDVKSTPIERFTEKGVIVGGKEIELDVIICASGFDALTGALTILDIRGEDGQTIKDVWSADDRRAGQPLGARKRARRQRLSGRMDRQAARAHARQRARSHRRGPRRAAALEAGRQRRHQGDGARQFEELVCRRERAGQDGGHPRLCGRHRQLHQRMRGVRRQGLCGVPAFEVRRYRRPSCFRSARLKFQTDDGISSR